MPFTRTNVRTWRQARGLILAPQAAEGTPVLDFTAGTGQVLDTRNVRFSRGQQFESFQGTHGSIQERSENFINTFQLPAIEVEFYPTPDGLAEMLRSCAGPFSGGSITWTEGIATFYSFLFAEELDGAAGYKARRLEDGWVHRLEIEDTGAFGVAVARAQIIGQRITTLDTDAAGLVYGAAPADFTRFAHKGAELIRDPAGVNVELAVRRFIFAIQHAFIHEPFNGEWGQITKDGQLEILGQLDSQVMDETLAIRDDAISQTFTAFRHRLISGATEIRFDLNDVSWLPADLGYADRNFLPFLADFRVGAANPPATNALDITFTPAP